MRTLICFLFLWSTVWASAFSEVRYELINVAARLQALEREMNHTEAALATYAQTQEKSRSTLASEQKALATLLRSVQNFGDLSPLITSFSLTSFKDWVHVCVLIKAFSPHLEKQNALILTAIKTSATARLKKREAESHLADLKAVYVAESQKRATLIEKKYTLKEQGPAQFTWQAPCTQALIERLDAVLPAQESSFTHETTLLQPVVGTIVKRPPHLRDLSVKLLTREKAHVITPWSGTVVYCHKNNDTKLYTIVLKQDVFYVVLNGLAQVFCREGDDMLAGEPLGLMPTASEEAHEKASSLSLELFKHTQTLDPLPYLKKQV